MFSVHQQTIRMYEKEGLLNPKRSDGNTRLFSEEDVERLEEIINLTHKMGVNLAGVDIILKLQKKLGKMQQDINKLFKQLDGDIVTQKEALNAGVKQQVMRLAHIKNDKQLASNIIDEIECEAEEIKPGKKAAKRPSKKAASREGDALMPKPTGWEVDYDDE